MNSAHQVYVDESYWRWFGRMPKESNLFLGALSIASDRVSELQRFEMAMSNQLREALSSIQSSVGPRGRCAEIKGTDLQYLPRELLDEVGYKIACFLKKNQVAVFGFYVPTEGFLAYRLRSRFIDKPDLFESLTESDWAKNIDDTRLELSREIADEDSSLRIFSEIYNQFFGFLAQYHGQHLKRSFRLVYDSRGEKSDIFIHKRAADFIALIDRAFPGLLLSYTGYTARDSTEEAGIRLVDWICAESRRFFVCNSTSACDCSDRKILSPYRNPAMTIVGGRAPFYEKKLSDDAARVFRTRGRGYLFPSLIECFAKDTISYYTLNGEARHLNLRSMQVYDMAD